MASKSTRHNTDSAEISEDGDPNLNALLDELIVQIESGSKLDVEQLCAKYPQHADRLRYSAKALLMLVEIGHRSHVEPSSATGLRRETLSALLGRSNEGEVSHDLIGKTIDRYKIREKLGEGGFGVVHVAEQLKPVRRKVAIKIIKLGMDSHEVIARFDAERQALAMMDHPHIAKIFDGGLTKDGRPYFAMELVRGVPLTKFCAHQNLRLEDRLELFCDICDAVQHAHHKGIIHRDLKPTNVMVTMRDDRPTVKVIDFGVAKAIHTRLTEHSIYTSFGQLVGTPLYMSPEQIQLNEFDVDTRSDVYSLGVILYELVTQTLPFSRKKLAEEGLESFRKLVCDSDPPRPSQRLSSRRQQAHLVDDRGSPDGAPNAIPRELDWIVMKALEKNRTRRYQSAGNLADDIRRFRRSDPVEACPPSTLYRFRKYVQRNRWQLTAVISLFLVLISGIAATTYQAVRARRAERVATELAETAEQKTYAARTAEAASRVQAEKAIAEKERADVRTEFARKVVDRMYGEFAFQWLARDSELTDLQHEFLESAMEFYGQLSKDELSTPEARHAAAVASYRYGSILLKYRRWDEAESALERTFSVFESLSKNDQFPQSGPLFALGNRSEMTTNGLETFGFEQELLQHPLGSLIATIRRLVLIPGADALGLLSRASDYAEQIGNEYPDEPLLLHYRSIVARTNAHALMNRGKLQQALDLIRRAQDLFGQVKPLLKENNHAAKREEVWQLVTSFEIRDGMGAAGQAEADLLRADQIVAKALRANAKMEGYVRDKIMIKKKLGKFYERQGRGEEAKEFRLEWCDAHIELSQLVPYDSAALNNGAWYVLLRDGITDEEAERAMKLAQLSLERDPNSSGANNTLGLAHYRQGDYENAIRYYRAALRLRKSVEGKLINHAMMALAYDAAGEVELALNSARIARDLAETVPISFDQQSFVRKAIELVPAAEQ